jgi:cysteine desulfurase
MGEDLARSTLRFGLGRYNTPEEVTFAAETVAEAVQKLRELG